MDRSAAARIAGVVVALSMLSAACSSGGGNAKVKTTVKPASTDSAQTDTAATDTGATDNAATDSGTSDTASADSTKKGGSTPVFGDGKPQAVIADGDSGGFLAVGDDGNGSGAAWHSSADGQTWKRTGKGSLVEGPNLTLRRLAFGNGVAVAVGSSSLTGTDLATALARNPKSKDTWTQRNIDINGVAGSALFGVTSSGTGFVAVGETFGTKADDPLTTKPLVLTSSDGSEWNVASAPPLPPGATGAYANAVTVAPSGTAFPGLVAVGVAWKPAAPGAEPINFGVVWQSPDVGATWKIVSDTAFDEDGRNIRTTLVAANDSTILVGGEADVRGAVADANGKKQETAIYFHIVPGQANGWTANVDTLPPNRSSGGSALYARPGGVFSVAELQFDTADKTNAKIEVDTTPGGNDYQTSDQLDGYVVTGIAVQGQTIMYVGLAAGNKGNAWIGTL